MNTTIRRRRSRVLKRIALGIAAAFTAWHLFASFLWIAPPSALRDLVPGDGLRAYMIPMFGQSWSVFAPEPINGDYYFDVRAVTLEGGEEVMTDWVRASDVEQSRARYHLFPTRSANLAVSQASSLKASYDRLEADHRVILELNYFEGEDWETRLSDKLGEYPGEEALVTAYLEQEHRAAAYATQVALAVWGDEVERIQFQAARQNIVPFAERHDPDAERPEPQIVSTGWRGLVVEDGQSQELFADHFCSAPLEVCRDER